MPYLVQALCALPLHRTAGAANPSAMTVDFMFWLVTAIGVSKIAGTLLPVWLISVWVVAGAGFPVASATAAAAASSASSLSRL